VRPEAAAGRTRGVADSSSDYVERVAKYIPAEVVAGYLAIMGMIEAADPDNTARMGLAWGLFVIGVIVTPVYLTVVGKPIGQQKITVWISTFAFVVWAYALGGPFKMSGYHNGLLGSVAVGVVTWLAGLFVPRISQPPGMPPTSVPVVMRV
jgi:xanthine/uracil permease